MFLRPGETMSQDKPRAVESLTDDEIVDAIAFFGVDGVDWSLSATNDVGSALTRLNCDDIEYERNALRARVARMRIRDNGRIRYCDGHGCHVISLSHIEWSERIAARLGLSVLDANTIANMLVGES